MGVVFPTTSITKVLQQVQGTELNKYTNGEIKKSFYNRTPATGATEIIIIITEYFPLLQICFRSLRIQKLNCYILLHSKLVDKLWYSWINDLVLCLGEF